MLPELQKLKEALEQKKSEMGEEELHQVQRELLSELAFLDYIGESKLIQMEIPEQMQKNISAGVHSVCPCCGRPFD